MEADCSDSSPNIKAFELRRQIDALVYRFDQACNEQGQAGFRRNDGDYWIYFHDRLGWIAGTWGSEEVFGRPWDQLNQQSRSMPPEGVWVSRKGSKSYV